MKKDKSNGDAYKVIDRIFWLIQQDEVSLGHYCSMFEISQKTAKRDLAFLRDRLRMEVSYSRSGRCYLIERPRGL